MRITVRGKHRKRRCHKENVKDDDEGDDHEGMVTAAKQRVAEKMRVVMKMMTVMGRRMMVKT